MNRLEAWMVHLATLLVGGTGIVYAWMRYFLESQDPFAVVNHPWEPTLQALHVLTAPLLVFAAGLIWQRHIWTHWRNGIRSGRGSGIFMVLTMVPMVASGYLIQTTVSRGWRTAWVVVHLVASGLWLGGYLVHLLARAPRRRRVRHLGTKAWKSLQPVRGVVAVVLVGLAAGAILSCRRPGEESPASWTEEPSLVVYSGRNEALIGPLLQRYEEERRVKVRVRYGQTSELAATLLEEGENTPADVFISQDAAALGALSEAGLFQPLPAEILSRVPERFAAPDGDWVGLSGRARVVVYNTARVRPEDLPQSLEEVVDPRFRGRFGIAPANASFQAHMAVYRAVKGREALEQLLRGMAENQPRTYPNNSTLVQGVIAGEIDWGLTNHYYLWRALQEDPGAPAANYFMTEGEASNFVNLAGTGLLRDHPEARDLLSFLLSQEAQAYFARETFEYPLIPEVPPSVALPPLEMLNTPPVDFRQVSEVLEETLVLIQESGLLP